jgi:WD40 repeat protein
MAFNFLKTLDSDDIFISYSRTDGSAYLTGLDAALSARGFSCFTDKRGTDAGRLPPKTLFRKIRTCKTLVLLATPGALQEPENIAPEVREFAEANGTSRIICVSFDRDAEFSDWSETPWYTYVEGKAREREDLSALKTGEPSPAVVEATVAASNYMKSKDRLRRYRNRAFGVLASLLIAIIAAAVLAGLMFKRAAAATAKASDETARAVLATLDAQAAVTQALTARVEAEAAKNDATRQGRLAKLASEDAAKKGKLAAEAARQARAAEASRIVEQAKAVLARREAEKQQEVALTRRLANQSALTLQQSPELLPRSVSYAVEAEKRSVGLGLRSLEADRALRDSLGLLAKSLGSKPLPEEIVATSFSPDAAHVATLSRVAKSDDSAERFTIRRTADGSEVATAACPCQGMFALSNGGRRVAMLTATDEGKFIRVSEASSNLYWDVPVRLSDDNVTDVALSPDGKYLVMSLLHGDHEYGEGTAELWNVETKKRISRLDTKGFIHIKSVAFSPGGKLFAISGAGVGARGRAVGRTLIWDLSFATDPENLTASDLRGPEEFLQDGEVAAVAVNDDGRYLATTAGQTALVWRKENQGGFQQVGRMPLKRNIDGMAFHADGKKLSTLSIATELNIAAEQAASKPAPRVLETWEMRGYREAFSASYEGEINGLAFGTGDEFVTTVSEGYQDDKVRVWRVGDGSEVKSANLMPQDAKEKPLEVTPDLRYIVGARSRVSLGVEDVAGYRVWDAQARKIIAMPVEPDFADLGAPILRPDGQLMGRVGTKRGEENRTLVIYRLVGDAYVRQTDWPLKTRNVKLTFSPSGGYLVADEGGNRPLSMLRVSDGQDITPARVKEFKSGAYFRISPTGNILAITSQEIKQSLKLLVWDVARGREIKIPHSNASLTNFVFSRSDRYLAVGGLDHSVQIFDLKQAGRPLLGDTQMNAGFEPSPDETQIVTAFSHDERYMATGFDNGMIKVFETATGEEVAHLPHNGLITNIVFSRDGTRLAASTQAPDEDFAVEGEANVLHVWLLNPADLIREACQRLARFSSGANYPSHCRGS